MPLTYAQIRKQQRLFGDRYADLTPDEFAQVMNNITGSNEYDAAVGTGLGSMLKALSYGIDRGIEATQLPRLTGAIGGALFGESGRQAFESVPRMAIDMLPFMRAGKLATAAGAAAMGINTYEKTDSPLAGALSAGTAPLFGPLQKLGGEAAVGLAGKLGLNTARTEAMAAGAGGLGLLTGKAATDAVANKFATQLAQGGVLKSGLARGVEQVGEQAGIAAANLTGQTITTAAAAPSGQRWDAVKQMWTTDLRQTLTMTALTQLPFAGMGLAKALGPQRAEANYVAKYSDTIRKYDESVYGPPRQLALADRIQTDLKAAVSEQVAEQSRMLPAPGTKTAQDFARETVGQYVTPDVRPDFAAKAEQWVAQAADSRIKPLQKKLSAAIKSGDVAKVEFYQRRLAKVRDVAGVNPSVDVLKNPKLKGPIQLPDAATIEKLSSDDPAVRVEAAMTVNETTPEDMAVRTTVLENKGLSLDEAAREVAAAETLKAKEQAIGLTAKQQRREAAKQETERRRQEQAADEANRFNLLVADNDGVSAVIKTAIGFASKDANQNLSTAVQRKALEWEMLYGRDEAKIDKLKEMLGTVTSNVGKRQPNHKSRVVVTNADPANVQVGAGNEGQVFKTRDEAVAARDALASMPNGNQFMWTVEAKNTKAKGEHFVISRKEWLESSVQGGGKEVVDQTLTPDEIVAISEGKQADDVGKEMFAQMDDIENKVVEAQDAVVESATEVGEDNGASVVAKKLSSAWDDYVASVRPAQLRLLGKRGTLAERKNPDVDAEVSLGKQRLEALWDAYQQARQGGRLEDIIVSSYGHLWKNFKDFGGWLKEASAGGALTALQDRMTKIVANGGSQFLSLTGAFAAGDGFFFNVVPMQNGKIGKHSVPKNGVISVEQFRKIGRGTDQPLTNDEIALYKTLVPEAFGVKAKDGVVFDNGTGEIARTANTINLPLFYETLPKREPTVEVRTFGNERVATMNERADLAHQLDTVWPGWYDNSDNPPSEQARQLLQRYENAEQRDGITRFSSIAPKAERDMPGYVEGLVRVPRETFQVRDTENRMFKDPLYNGPHFGSEDTNVVGFFRGYMETLPSGETAFHVIEVQSDWGQTVQRENRNLQNDASTQQLRDLLSRATELHLPADEVARLQGVLDNKKSSSDHPLLSAYEELALKAAIKHARENGATKLILSDAETAMMSEMHDVAGNLTEGRPSQEKGMRLHYDTTLPSLLRKISGDKGQRVDLGVHVKTQAQPHQNGPIDEFGAPATITLAREANNGSPVFKDANGKPKTTITGTLYDISNVKMAESGSGQTFGQQQPVFVGERQALGQLLRNVGVDERMVPEVSRLVSLWDNNDVAYAQLQTGGQAAGLFTQQTDGQKLVWLAASGDPASRKMFVLAHELNGHGLWKAMEEGKLDSETTRKLTEYARHIGENTPEQNSILLRELWGTLPKRYRKDDGLQKMVNSRLEDPEEVLANMNAIVSLALVNKGRPGWINEVMTWLPKPIGDAFGVMAKWGRKVFESISGLMFMRRQNWTRGTVDPTQLTQLHDYVKTLHSVLKADRNREALTEYAIRQEMATDPRALMNSLVDGRLWEDGITTAGNQLVQEFRLLKEKEKVNPVREALGKVNRGLNHFLQPLVNYAQTMPWLRQTVVSGAIRAMDNNRMEGAVLKEMGLVKDGLSYRWSKDAPTQKVMNSPKLATALNELVWRANPMEQMVEQLLAAGDPVVTKTLSKLSPAEQQTVRETIARHEVANRRLNELVKGQQYERLVFATAEILMLKDPNMQSEQAEATARQLVEGVRAGAPVAHEASDFVAKQAGKIEANYEWFTNRPYFVSARRFGDHAIMVEKADGTHSVENFYTAESLQAWLAKNRDRIQSGELTPYRLKPDEAISVNVGTSILDLIKDREAERRPELVAELRKMGLTDEQADSIAGRFSEAADLQQEIQAKLVPSRGPHRKFVDGYQNLNALRQQIEYSQMVIHSITKGVDTARFNMGLLDPRIRNTPEAASIKQAWMQNKAPDMNGTRLLQRAGYTWYMSAHLLNMLQDATTPISGALFSSLVNDGGGVVSTGKRILTAMKDVKAASRQTAFERQMLERYKEGNGGLATFSDEANNDYLASVNALESAQGLRISSLGDLLTKPIHHGFLTLRNFHKHFIDFGMEAGMLATFRHFKAKGLSDVDAEKAAFALSTVAMGGGKYNRAAGVWASGRLQPLSAMMTMLQGFAYNQMFTSKNWLVRALDKTAGITKQQKLDAIKAFGVHNGLMFAQAGIFGLSLVAALLAINDKMFGTNTKENIASFIQENIDGPDSDVVRQIAMHGLINAFGGVDYATKAQMPGVLGLNAQNGFSLESLFGPAYSLGETVVESGKQLFKGDVGGAVSNVLPNNFRRALQAYRDDWEFRRKDGSLIAETTAGDKALYTLFGLKPRNVVDLLERDAWQAIDANNERSERSQWLDDMVELFKQNPADARGEILKRAGERGESPAALANTVADRLLEMQMPRDAGRRPGASEQVNRAAGVRPTTISEVQRVQAQQALLQRLNMGMPATQATYKRAMLIDQVRAQAPWISYEEAQRRVNQMLGNDNDNRGAWYGVR